MIKTIIAFVLFAPAMLAAQENGKKYIWPLTIDNGISSTFQEFRSNHFHAGIDLRTFKTTGFPVRAIAAGVVEKIIVSNAGIGRAVFLRHGDGNLSLYGHLERFRDDLESIVAREQKRSGEKYFGTYELSEVLPARQGEVIAFSGESGNGLAHLHLEIRDPANASLNPLSWVSSPAADTNAPVLKGILLRSRGAGMVNDDPGESYFKLLDTGLFYTTSEVLAVNGSFDLLLHATDISDAGRGVAPYSLEACLDGQLVYQVVFERLLRDDNNQLGMLYDMEYSFPSSYFYKLFFQSGFTLEKSQLSFAAAVDRLAPGAHEIKIIVRDRQLNQAIARIAVQKLPETDGRSINKKLDLKTPMDRVLLDANVSLYVYRGDVFVKVRDFPRPADWIQLQVLQGSQQQAVAAREYGSGVYFCFKPANNDMNLQLRFILTDGQRPVQALQKNIRVLALKSQCAQQFRSGDFVADFAAKTVLEPTVMILENERLAADYPLLAGPVRIGPAHFTFLDTVIFKFKIPPGQVRREQMGIFKYSSQSKKWNYVKTQNVPEAGYLGSRVLSGGIFALLRDVYPPEIRFRSRRARRFETCESLLVRLHDRGKGINERSVLVFLNGRKTDSDYDPDWGHIRIAGSPGLRKGWNGLRVQVDDLAGNRSAKEFHFHLH